LAPVDLSEVYGEQYYRGYYERSPKWFDFFHHIADRLVEQFAPKKTLDAGCAWGLLVEALRSRGVESFGIDFSSYALTQVHPDIQPYCRRASLAEPITGGPYDLVTCIEVLEHMEEADALRAIENLTAVTDVILFSSTPDDIDDPTHINVQPLLYWLRAFAKHDFYPIAGSDASFVAEHALLLQKSAPPTSDAALTHYAELIELRNQVRRMANRPAAGRTNDSPEEMPAGGAWQLIRRYRYWRDDLQARSPGLFRVWERAAQAVLRLAGGGGATETDRLIAGWDYAQWIQAHEPGEAALRAQEREARSMPYRPKISIVMPVYEIPLKILHEAIASVQAQTYDNWELCASVIPSLNPSAAALLKELAAGDARIRVCTLDSNLGIAGNSERARELASGDFIALLDHDDTLAPFALYEAASLLNEDPSANFIYSDRDEIGIDGSVRSNPFFKPAWSPEILMSANYLTHLCVMRTERLREIGGWRTETDGAQDWDLFLRLTLKYGGVRHIPKILYHWRHARSSVAMRGLDCKPYARQAQVRTVESYCRSVDLRHETAFVDGNPKIVWRLNELPSVTIIILSAAGTNDTAENARRISRRPECERVEIVCPAAGPDGGTEARVKFVPVRAGADILGQAEQLVDAATGEVLVFIDGHVELDGSDWLREVVGPLSLPGVGLCGVRLEDPRRARHKISIAFDREGNASAVHAEHAPMQFLPGWDVWLRNWSAVSGACFAIRRRTWDEVGGFAAPSGHSRPDIRLCLKLAEKGLRVVGNPAARVRQTALAALELPLRNQSEEDRRIVRAIFPQGDPHVSPHLCVRDGLLIPR
jgi:cellulose synthase/poly-beta-1,6-N-acetylglucosamine synthase-like glycosyltransferase